MRSFHSGPCRCHSAKCNKGAHGCLALSPDSTSCTATARTHSEGHTPQYCSCLGCPSEFSIFSSYTCVQVACASTLPARNNDPHACKEDGPVRLNAETSYMLGLNTGSISKATLVFRLGEEGKVLSQHENVISLQPSASRLNSSLAIFTTP